MAESGNYLSNVTILFSTKHFVTYFKLYGRELIVATLMKKGEIYWWTETEISESVWNYSFVSMYLHLLKMLQKTHEQAKATRAPLTTMKSRIFQRSRK